MGTGRDIIEASIRKGLKEGDDLLAKREAAEKEHEDMEKSAKAVGLSDVHLAFKHASSLIEGFNILKNMPGSKVEFSPSTALNDTTYISTNIETQDSFKMTLLVGADGSIRGGNSRFYKTEEVLKFAAKRAKIQGLIPKNTRSDSI
ncbi:MAG: hypothetical protein V1721_08470 [Pseudomonadota bacterium]